VSEHEAIGRNDAAAADPPLPAVGQAFGASEAYESDLRLAVAAERR
jgi:hypothetical protein